MPNYADSKIYIIRPLCEHDEGEVYIGSTTNRYLCERMASHRRNYKRYLNGKSNFVSIYLLFNKYGVENFDIFLVEEINVNSKEELHSHEGRHIRTSKNINYNLKGVNKDNKNFKDHKTRLSEYKKLFLLENKDKATNENIEQLLDDYFKNLPK